MATATAASPATPRKVGAYDRVFYTTMTLAMAGTVFVGFGPTFYFRVLGSQPLISQTGAPFTPLLHFHAALFTLWVVLFVVQTALVATDRVAVHRRLGTAGAVLAVLMVMAGVGTAISAAARGAAPPGFDPLRFLAIPLGDMLTFATFVSTALYWRRDKEMHKRLMLLAYISIIGAALARIPAVAQMGPAGFFGFTLIFVVAGIAYDVGSRRRVHPAYLWGGSFLAASVPLRMVISSTEAWKTLAEALTRMV